MVSNAWLQSSLDTLVRDAKPFVCLECFAEAKRWRDNFYDPVHPCEWPGRAIILDNRTSHVDRERDWITKNTDAARLTIANCAHQGTD